MIQLRFLNSNPVCVTAVTLSSGAGNMVRVIARMHIAIIPVWVLLELRLPFCPA